MSEKLISTYSIVKMTNVYAAVVFINNCYCKFNSSRFRSVYNNLTFTILDSWIVFYNFSSYSSIFVALVCNIDLQVAIDLSEVAFFIDNFNSYFVVFVNSTFGRIKFESECIVRINDCQFYHGINTIFITVTNYSDSSPQQRFISSNICLGDKVCTNFIVNNSFPITADNSIVASSNLQAVFVNKFCNYCNILTKSNFVCNIGLTTAAQIFSIDIKNNIFYSTKFCDIKFSGRIITAKQRYSYCIVTWDEIFFSFIFIVTNIFERVAISIFN